jgi:glucose/arabinose dehydrogenase
MLKMGGVSGKKKWTALLTLLGILLSALIGYIVWSGVKKSVVNLPDPLQQIVRVGTPELETATVVEGLSHVWDLAFAPDGAMYFSERGGDVSLLKDGRKQIVEHPTDMVSTGGEGGLMGLTLDPDFATNRLLYACFNTAEDVRLVRWRVSADGTHLENRADIVTGIPRRNAGGRHSGCRPRFGIDGYLWIATGDAAIGTNAQDPDSLGGKILRVDRGGRAAPDNFGEPFDPRVYSYGHRNGQGLAFYTRPRRGVVGYSVEHGPDIDDEINELKPGNFGWDPVPGYNEGVPMTDKQKFPDAIDAVWSSGTPTIAPSGATILRGSDWQSWNGALAVAALKGQHVRIFSFDTDGKVKSEAKVLDGFGRIRSVVMGPDDALYFTTDNGTGRDRIVRVLPK